MKFVTCLVLLSLTAVLCRAGALHGMLEGKENGNIWALLVAGSNTWMNYRHQVYTAVEIRVYCIHRHVTLLNNYSLRLLTPFTFPLSLLQLLQADICHAYQILHAHGVPDDQIVVMMYNDIAYNEE